MAVTGCQHGGGAAWLVHRHTHLASLINLQQSAQARHNAPSKCRQTLWFSQSSGGCQDLLQPPATSFQLANLRIRAHRHGHAGEQTSLGQFGFGAIVVDVVALDGFQLGRIAGLAGAQNNAQCLVAQGFTNVAHQMQSSIFGLHHHIDESYGEIVWLGQQVASLLC